MRAQGPVSRATDDGPWIVVGFDECDEVLRNEDVFAHPSRRDLMSAEEWRDVSDIVGGESAIALLEGEVHKRMHREIAQRLSRNMERYRVERIRPVVVGLMDAFVGAGGGDFASAVADPLPPTVIASVLGLEWRDETRAATWKRLDEQVLRSRMDFETPEEALRDARAASEELNAMLEPIVRARRDEPKDDFISQLWDFIPDILPGCDERDVIAQCRQIFAGGTQSTTYLLCNAAALLFTRPQLWQRLAHDRSRIERFIEETLRVMNVIHGRPRVAVRATRLGKKAIEPGDRLFVSLPAANRDPQRYRSPTRLDLDGPAKRHMAFGSGPRICPGAAFARAEAREAILCLLDRFESPSLDPERAPPAWRVEDELGSWRPLNVRV